MGRQMASMHEVRDRAILTVQRLLDAQGSVFHESGYNKRKVGPLVSTGCILMLRQHTAHSTQHTAVSKHLSCGEHQ